MDDTVDTPLSLDTTKASRVNCSMLVYSRVTFAILMVAVVAACATTGSVQQSTIECTISPPTTTADIGSADREAKNLEADILGYVSGKAGSEQELEEDISVTYDKLSDPNITCQMFLQAATCLSEKGKDRMAEKFLESANQHCPNGPAGPASR